MAKAAQHARSTNDEFLLIDKTKCGKRITDNSIETAHPAKEFEDANGLTGYAEISTVVNFQHPAPESQPLRAVSVPYDSCGNGSGDV